MASRQVGEIIPLATGNVASVTHCAQVIAELTSEERSALKAISLGHPAGCSVELIGRLQTLGLIKHNGRQIAITGEGELVARLC
jgi:hypothetical protein